MHSTHPSVFWLPLLLTKDSVKLPLTVPQSLELLHMFPISNRDGQAGCSRLRCRLLCTFGCKFGLGCKFGRTWCHQFFGVPLFLRDVLGKTTSPQRCSLTPSFPAQTSQEPLHSNLAHEGTKKKQPPCDTDVFVLELAGDGSTPWEGDGQWGGGGCWTRMGGYDSKSCRNNTSCCSHKRGARVSIPQLASAVVVLQRSRSLTAPSASLHTVQVSLLGQQPSIKSLAHGMHCTTGFFRTTEYAAPVQTLPHRAAPVQTLPHRGEGCKMH